jgi:hypothetical protein
MAATEDWPRSYVIPSTILSVTAAGFLVWHVLDPNTHIDGWAITLLVVGFLPWLRTVFESIDLPGGGSVTWRKAVEAKQERQAEDIEALQFMLARFITDGERGMLQKLATGVSIPITNEGDDHGRFDRAKSLHRGGLIAAKPRIVEAQKNGTPIDLGNLKTLNDLYDITASGRQYLALIAELPADINAELPDPTRPS